MSKRKDEPKVYLASFPNGKKYVGITTATLALRKSEHYSRAKNGSKLAIHNALNKYKQNVKWEVLTVCHSYEAAKIMEIEMIEKINTMSPNGYNLTKGGDGTVGYKATAKHRKNLSESHKGYIMTEEQKKNISDANKDRKQPYAMKIVRTNINNGLTKIYESMQGAVKDGFNRHSVYSCINGKRNSVFGYRFQKLEVQNAD